MDELIAFKFAVGKNIYVKRLNYEIQISLTNKKMIICCISVPVPTIKTDLGLEGVMHGSRQGRAEKQLLLVK